MVTPAHTLMTMLPPVSTAKPSGHKVCVFLNLQALVTSICRNVAQVDITHLAQALQK
jgi:hypothetical protein